MKGGKITIAREKIAKEVNCSIIQSGIIKAFNKVWTRGLRNEISEGEGRGRIRKKDGTSEGEKQVEGRKVEKDRNRNEKGEAS